jgi:hypothetical protein
MYRNSGQLGDWYNNWGDLAGDIKEAWNFIQRIRPTVHDTAVQVAQNTRPPGVFSDFTSGQNPLLTYGTLAVGSLLIADLLKRRNPRGRRRRSHARRRR